MTPRRHHTKPPAIDPLTLRGLDQGFAGDLESGGLAEALEFSDLDLAEADLDGITVSECSFRGVRAHGASWRGARILESRWERIDAPVLDLSRSTLRDVEVTGSRIGALDIYEAELRSVRFTGCKLDWMNLRGATLEDVLFEDCTIGEIDLGGATATRVSFRSSRADSLTVARSRLADVDLRDLQVAQIDDLRGLDGATIGREDAVRLAESLAQHLGIRVED